MLKRVFIARKIDFTEIIHNEKMRGESEMMQRVWDILTASAKLPNSKRLRLAPSQASSRPVIIDDGGKNDCADNGTAASCEELHKVSMEFGRVWHDTFDSDDDAESFPDHVENILYDLSGGTIALATEYQGDASCAIFEEKTYYLIAVHFDSPSGNSDLTDSTTAELKAKLSSFDERDFREKCVAIFGGFPGNWTPRVTALATFG